VVSAGTIESLSRSSEDSKKSCSRAIKGQAAEQIKASIDRFYSANRIQKELSYLCPIAYEAKTRQPLKAA
jgi:hypothetical protein